LTELSIQRLTLVLLVALDTSWTGAIFLFCVILSGTDSQLYFRQYHAVNNNDH